MRDKIRKFHHENIKAAVESLFQDGDLDPRVNYVKNGQLFSFVMRPGMKVNQATLLQEVAAGSKPEMMSYVAMGCLHEDGSVTSSRDDSAVEGDDGRRKTVLIVVTFVPGGDDNNNLINILEVRKEGKMMVATNAVGKIGDEGRIIFQDDQPTSTEVLREGLR